MTRKGILCLIITILLFSSYEVVSKLVAEGLNPYQINFLRFTSGGLLLLFSALKEFRKKQLKINFKDIISFTLLGVLNVGISMNFLQIGINYTQANVAAVIFSSNPLFVALTSALFLREPLTAGKIAGLLLGFSGVVLTFAGGGSFGGGYNKGILLLVLSAATFGVYTVLAKRITLRVGSLIMNSFSFLCGSMALLPFLLSLRIPLLTVDPNYLPMLLYLGVCVTGIGYYCYFTGLSLVDTSLGSMVFFVKPLLAALLAWAVLEEKIGFSFLMGIFLVTAGLYLVHASLHRAGKLRNN